MLNAMIMAVGSAPCTDVYQWQCECDYGNLSDKEWRIEHCSGQSTWNQPCEVFENVECEGNRSFTRMMWCPNGRGADYSTAVFLTFVFGMIGIDRFYLGYYALGLLKLFTGGVFMIGYLIDCVLITLQIVRPVDGSGFAAVSPFPLLTKEVTGHRDIV